MHTPSLVIFEKNHSMFKPAFLFIQVAFVSLFAFSQVVPPYKNASLPIEQRVKDLLSRMTPEELAGQLNQISGGKFTGPGANESAQQQKMKMTREGKVGSMLNVTGAKNTRAIQQEAMKSRLGIPLLFGLDVIHGYKTIFPIPLAEACSWDLEQIRLNASIAAREAASAGIHWTFAPMCDISNDIRWGRVMEGAGEDPYYGALVAAARVKGFQGKLKGNQNILACVKHFAGYGAVEAGREYNSVDFSRIQLWNKYLPPYKAAVDAGAATVMNAFNVFEGVPASANKYLIQEVLKKKWGFNGFLVSDWASFKEMINHGYSSDDKDAAMKALQAGSMMDMEGMVSITHLPALLKEGKISLSQMQEAVGRILYFKFKLGLFENPFAYCDEKNEAKTIYREDHREIARLAARKSIVLLKNNESILPLRNDVKVALIGRYADSKEDMFDFWVAQGESDQAVTIREAMENYVGGNMVYAPGYKEDNSTNQDLIDEAVSMASQSAVIIVNIGISGKMAGEDRALAFPEISAGQMELLKALKSLGKPMIALVSSGRPLVLTEAEKQVDALVQTWILGSEHGRAVVDMLYGEFNPSGKTVMSFPYAIGQIPVSYNHFNTNRPAPSEPGGDWYSRYRDIPNEPLYPFGYGMSYTTYTYSNLKLSKSSMTKTDTVTVTVNILNNTERAGEEIVQLYIRDHAASYIRPVRELKAFQVINIGSVDQQQAVFKISAKDLSFYNEDGKQILEPGKFTIMVGGNSRDLLSAELMLK
jgi:beta-glucosidase